MLVIGANLGYFCFIICMYVFGVGFWGGIKAFSVYIFLKICLAILISLAPPAPILAHFHVIA